jgi:hypothetical protein
MGGMYFCVPERMVLMAKSRFPRLGTLVPVILIIDGSLLVLKLLGYKLPLNSLMTDKVMIWIAAVGCIYSGVLKLITIIKHKTIKSLL